MNKPLVVISSNFYCAENHTSERKLLFKLILYSCEQSDQHSQSSILNSN